MLRSNIIPLAIFPPVRQISPIDTMSAETKIAELIKAEEKFLEKLAFNYETSKQRALAFCNAMGAVASDKAPGSVSIHRAINSKLTQEMALQGEYLKDRRASEIRKAAYEESLKLCEKPSDDQIEKDLRASSELYTVREFIRNAGKPCPLGVIVADGLGYKGEMASGYDAKYASLRGTLSGYAKENRIFTIESKPPESEMHIIGLLEFKDGKLVVPKRPGSMPPPRPKFAGGGEAVPIS